MLPGYKTYITAILLGLLSAVKYMGWISDDAYQALVVALLGGGIFTLRAGVAKAEEKAERAEQAAVGAERTSANVLMASTGQKTSSQGKG